jgi:SpoVK/Ycf46/Vps4 family AAA+-type ATPase
MVALPLLYPEIFMRFKITPPRGVLFHGPPGTGKTLLARALATSVSSQGKKVTFYMRKGADALSKWVGEAERQLRLLFEEARKNQPSIIFFDEIDGLAPVRSSKQEQIHASIVSTLLALMDGMDGRGQVIVIGATNRPDSIDPALRRPGRFDREFYFPLPDTEARKAIIDIHTKGWEPPLPEDTKKHLAEQTKGYGGADLRALCTEAALNAVQRRYPQIYSSNQKLAIDPRTIEVSPKDFMISIKKMTPSSERSASMGAAPLPLTVAPLLQSQLDEIQRVLSEVLPQRKNLTALEEAQFEDVADGGSFGREKMQQAFETSRVFRPRLLIHGKIGMGQQYVASALLNHFEGLHVQALDIPTLLGDTASSPEATVIRLFSEVKMHKPSVIYIPNVQEWYNTVGPAVISTFVGLLRSIKPTDPVLLLGFAEGDYDDMDESMRREFFGYSKKNQFALREPGHAERAEFFLHLKNYISTAPDDFPDPQNRKKREFEKLDLAPPEPEKPKTPPSKEELKAQKRRDRQTLNLLKIRLQPIMDQIRTKYKTFRTGVIDESQFRYLYDEADPGTVSSDLNTDVLARATYRPFEIGEDAHGVPGLVDQGNGNFYYNLDSVTIEKRLSNGYYKRPKDFLADIKRLAKDAKTIGDEPRLLKANELLANVEVDIASIEMEPGLAAECERVYQRELEREKEALAKARQDQMPPPQVTSNIPPDSGPTTTTDSGPILLGVPMQRKGDIAQQLAPKAAQATSSETIMTNGVHPSHDDTQRLTNGSESNGHEADVEGDTRMEGTDSHPASGNKSNETQQTPTTSSFGARDSAQTRPWHDYTAPSQHLLKQQGISQPPSQTAAFTPMPHGSLPGQFLNDASTTESPNETNKKTSPSQNTQQEVQQDSGPDLYPFDERRSAGGSQIPSTQGMGILAFGSGDTPNSPSPASSSHNLPDPFKLIPETGQNSQPQPAAGERPSSSQGQVLDFNSQHSTAMPPPVDTKSHRPSNASRIDDLLNPSASPQQPPSAARPNLIQVEQQALSNLHKEITDKTSGLSVEQLEQVNSVLMDTLWRTRSEWDRHKVMESIAEAFYDVLRDMEGVGQDLGEMSWGRKG